MRKVIELALWMVSALSLLAYAFFAADGWLYQSRAEFEFHELVTSSAPGVPLVSSPGAALGRLEIPSIDLSAIFVEGAGNAELRRAVGHIPGTALPGESGNIGLAGHRDTFFRRLGDVRKGDLIRVAAVKGTYQYIVDSIQIVNPDEAIVLHDIGRPVVTLVTCYPFNYFGSAPKRYIVHASAWPLSTGLYPRAGS
jgi:sortase A